MNERICVCVDLIGMFGPVKAVFDGRKINYGKYLSKVEEVGSIYRAYAYGAYINNEANTFINCLKNIGFEVKYVKATYVDGAQNIKETSRTMDMVIDIVRIIDKIDTVVLGTLDTNLIPFINFLKERGIKVILFSCNSKKELKLACNEYWKINETVIELPQEEYVE